MAEPEILEQIKAILSGAAGVGVVHEYQRLATEWKKVLDLFKDDTGKINAACISRNTILTRQRTAGEVELAYVFTIRFYRSLQDEAASERDFQGMLDAAVTAFISESTLNGTCEITRPNWGPMSGAVGLRVDIIDQRLFGGVLCHFAEGRLCTLTSTTG